MSEDMNPALRHQIEQAGFFTTHQRGDDGNTFLVLASERTNGMLHGNSFKILNEHGHWRLETWAPVCYDIPADADLAALCVECLRASRTPIARVPEGIVQRYGLRQIAEHEAGT